ncbi:MAG TPA: hypothetical protein VK756_07700 [Solirubrobacteraceae bacterium]|jgi:hypothetical protein|nr:hypothetical protein [Solirubrobacteraceae bacterium]
MAGRGPAPKPAAARQRTNRKSTAAKLEADPTAEVPALPDLPDEDGNSHTWHPQTLAEWDAIWRSPMASQWPESDYFGLAKLIVVVDDFWWAGSASARREAAVEIRLQRSDFGLAPRPRAGLHWEIARAEEADARAAKRKPPAEPAGAGAVDPRQRLRAVK